MHPCRRHLVGWVSHVTNWERERETCELVIQLHSNIWCDDTMTFHMQMTLWLDSSLWRVSQSAEFSIANLSDGNISNIVECVWIAHINCRRVENLFRTGSRVDFEVKIVMTKFFALCFNFSTHSTYGRMNLHNNNLPALFHVTSCRSSLRVHLCSFPYLLLLFIIVFSQTFLDSHSTERTWTTFHIFIAF